MTGQRGRECPSFEPTLVIDLDSRTLLTAIFHKKNDINFVITEGIYLCPQVSQVSEVSQVPYVF